MIKYYVTCYRIDDIVGLEGYGETKEFDNLSEAKEFFAWSSFNPLFPKIMLHRVFSGLRAEMMVFFDGTNGTHIDLGNIFS